MIRILMKVRKENEEMRLWVVYLVEYLVLSFLVDFYFTSGEISARDIIKYKLWTQAQAGFENFRGSLSAKVDFEYHG